MADNNTIARPYAQAVFEIAQANNALAELAESLGAARDLMADGQAAAFLTRPSLSDEDRLSFLQGLFETAVGKGSVFVGGSDHGTNFLKILIENGRVNVLPEIADHYDALQAQVEGTLDVVVTSATPLSDAQQAEISKSLKTRFDREIRLETVIDENLIGGAVIRAGDVVIDGSLRARLDGLTNALIK